MDKTIEKIDSIGDRINNNIYDNKKVLLEKDKIMLQKKIHTLKLIKEYAELQLERLEEL